jgi:hypothetical protein
MLVTQMYIVGLCASLYDMKITFSYRYVKYFGANVP